MTRRGSISKRLATTAIAGALAVSCISSTAAAQPLDGLTLAQADRLLPPKPQKEPEGGSFFLMIAAVICIAAVGGAVFMPSKRGHQD